MVCKGRPRNTPKKGIMPPLSTVIRQSAGQRSWQREPFSHQYLGPRASQIKGRVARDLAKDGFAVVNSQESSAREGNNRQEEPSVKRGFSRGKGGSRDYRGRRQPYEGIEIIDFNNQ